MPFVHTLLQHSAPVVQVLPLAVHGVSQRPPSQTPWQQSLSTMQVAPCAAHDALPVSHRCVCLSQTIEQHRLCGLELQLLPILRQVVFAMSSWHSLPFPVSMQMFEQQFASAAQGSLSWPHSAPPHVPPLQFKLQQSVAFAHGATRATAIDAGAVSLNGNGRLIALAPAELMIRTQQGHGAGIDLWAEDAKTIFSMTQRPSDVGATTTPDGVLELARGHTIDQRVEKQ